VVPCNFSLRHLFRARSGREPSSLKLPRHFSSFDRTRKRSLSEPSPDVPSCVFVYLTFCWDLDNQLLPRMAFPQLHPALFILIALLCSDHESHSPQRYKAFDIISYEGSVPSFRTLSLDFPVMFVSSFLLRSLCRSIS
jgi:hypothetical protein